MASGNPLNIGTSGLLASQRALATISHNVSNVNTEGYSRQESIITSRNPTYTGAGFQGNGADVTNVRRMADEFLTKQLEMRTSEANYQESYHKYASRVDNLLADPEAGLDPAISSFFDANQGVADDPSAVSAREVLLSNGETLTERFQTMYRQLETLEEQVNTELSDGVQRANALGEEIAALNEQIATVQGSASGNKPNDLLDQREKLIKDLSELVEVQTVEQDNQAVNVYIGKGQSLVSNFQAKPMEIIPNQYDSSRNEIGYRQADSVVNVTDLIDGGKLGSVKDFRQEILDPAINSLGRVAYGMAENYNAQHRQGMNLNGELGGDFFDIEKEPVKPNPDNSAGAPTVQFEITDASQLTDRDYRLVGTGGSGFRLLDDKTNEELASGIAAGSDVTVDGVTFSVGAGSDNAGDSYLIQPTRAGGRTIEMAANMDEAAKVAAASPVRVESSTDNRGDAQLSEAEVYNTNGGAVGSGDGEAFSTSKQLNPPLEIRITGEISDTEYDIEIENLDTNNTVTGTYDSTTGMDVIDHFETNNGDGYNDLGYDVRLSGDPGLGDTYSIEYNQGGVSDNSNMLQLANLQTDKTMLDGEADFQETYSSLVTDVGTRTAQAETGMDAKDKLLTQAREARESVSGVNLDEEAAEMMKFQQSYQAASRVISASQSMFDSLISIIR
ncbi:flagellar hook-associated protein 1 FlgK [Thiohalospira halophila DSM 15071]|uniref:Flagellar hook-associated protein 1 n=1 Tax=Thiohalospira halophila DSM 15071 TaxID=1123397 RepID=A0A1I1WC90_9GAMM|nr:flagellar hook-associated protein FlgK [Thiohalospira halophila]SFD92712.1 flagellar hook-associated protein 1 FlgK [Thiohalospira halophila DSM 15071]